MSKRLIEKKERIALKVHQYEIEGKTIRAKYWQRKLNKIADIEKKAAALIKRKLATQGIKKLNTVKI